MSYSLGPVLLKASSITRRVAELGARITRDMPKCGQILVVGVLNGAAVFVADLIRQMPPDLDVRLMFASASSYKDGTESEGAPKIQADWKAARGRHVLIVDDILDTGLTLSTMLRKARRQLPVSVRSCVLLDKKERRKTKVEADYVGFEIPDEFVVGYGLDCVGMWRHLRDIRSVKVEEDEGW